jgi:Membrane-bound metallopeptidase
MKTSQLLTLVGLGATLILAPATARVASADKEHPVFDEHPGKHKGWDKHNKTSASAVDDHHDRRYYHVADTRHEHLYPRTVTRTSTGYWHTHDGYPRHFHYYRTPAPTPPHQHVRREVVVVDRTPVARKDYQTIRDARSEIKAGRDQLRKQNTELEKDRAELRRDIRSGASKTEIQKDRQELRDDAAQIRKTREELAADRARLETARRTVR